MEDKLKQLKTILGEVDDIGRAAAIAGWDQEANMPPGGVEGRSYILSTLRKMAHEKRTSPEVADLIAALEPYGKELDPDSNDASLIREFARQFKRASKVPGEMVAEKAKLSSMGNQAWREAREASDFSKFQDVLEQLVDWSKRYAEIYADEVDHPYDALLQDYESDLTTADVRKIFDDIRPKQVELIAKIAEKPEIDSKILHQNFEIDKQKAFGREVTTTIGFDWNRGFEGTVTHPFATNLGYGDQRINNRAYEDFFNPYFFGCVHEMGHGLYEQGVAKELARTPLYGGTSLAVHESQSRMFENLIGRSKPFWTHFYPKLQGHFPSQLGNVEMEDFYKAINKVAPSYIRVEADEATYNLHIMLRLELEIDLIEGKVDVKDLPEAWNARFEEYLGIVPPNDAEGVLQDVHWSMGLYGYFSTYALGNLVSVQLWEKMLDDMPDMYDKIASADFKDLLGWLVEKVHKHGSKYQPQDLIKRVTGTKIEGDPYIKYLNEKYSEIYNL